MGSAAQVASLPTILIVEDEFLARAMLSDHLQECGFMVFEAANADEAINTIEAGIPVDLVADSRAASLVAWRATGSELARVKVEPERQKCGTVLQARLWLPSNSRKR